MGDMGEIFNAMREHNKKIREKNKLKWAGRLLAIGAEPKSSGVYQYKDWFIYPTKNFVMNRFNTDKRMSIKEFMKEVENER